MDLTDLLAKVGAELMARKRISNVEFVSPQRTDTPQAVHALWPLARDPALALYLRATPEGDEISVYAQVAQYHEARHRITQGASLASQGGFSYERRIPHDAAVLLDDFLPCFEAYDALASPRE